MRRAVAVFVTGLAVMSAAAGGEKPGLVPSPEAPVTGVVSVNRLNVRKGPGTAYDCLGQLNEGDKVVVRHAQGGWYEVDYPEGSPVWISAKYVSLEGDAGAASLQTPLAGVVTKSGVRMRNRPSIDRGAILGERQKDDEVRVVRSFGGWYQILPPPEMRCYLHSDYVDLVGPWKPRGPGEREPKADELLPLDLEPDRASREAPGVVEGVVPSEVEAIRDAMERVAAARKLLSGAPSLEEAERALRLLERALAARDLAVREQMREHVKDVLGGLEPGVWLSLLEKARIQRAKELEELGGPKAPLEQSKEIREVEDTSRRHVEEAGEEPAPDGEIEYTARGLLQAPVAGTGRYRLVHGETLLYGVEAGEADLSPFVGKGVGVVGEFRPAGRRGEAPWILVSYIEELAP